MNRRTLFARCLPSLDDLAFLAPAILLFCLMGGVASMLVDGDTGWHLRAGEWILDHHQVPTADFFTFTKSGQPWFAFEWLWDATFAFLNRVGGMPAVILGNLIVLGLMSMHLYRLVLSNSRNYAFATGATLVSLLGMSLYLLARPQLVSFLFAVILLRLLRRWRESQRGFPWTIVLLLILWTNAHPGFTAGLIILVAYTAGDLANALAAPDAHSRTELLSQFRRSALLTAACAGAALLNPYGFRLYSHIFSFLSDSYPYQHINEYKVVDFRTGPGRVFELILFLSAPAALSRLLKRDFSVPVLFLVWAHLALTAQRNIPFFMIVMAGPVALWVGEVLAPIARSWGRDANSGSPEIRQSSNTGIPLERAPGMPVLGILTMALIFVLLRTPGSPPKFRPQYDPSVYPREAISAVSQLGPSARLITNDYWAGYLIYRLYPQIRIFWDGRADFYGTPYNLAAVDALMGRPGWDKTLATHQVNAALLPLNQPLASLLAQSKEWRVVYRGEIAILFELTDSGKVSTTHGSNPSL